MAGGTDREMQFADQHQQDFNPCANSSSVAFEILKQRIRFEALDADLQIRNSQQLAKQALAARSSQDPKDALYALIRGVAWLRPPVKAESGCNESQERVRQVVAVALESIALCNDLSEDFTTPALEILHEIVRARDAELHEASGRQAWSRIALHLYAPADSQPVRKYQKHSNFWKDRAAHRRRNTKRQREVRTVDVEEKQEQEEEDSRVQDADSARCDTPAQSASDINAGRMGCATCPRKRFRQNPKQSGIQNISWQERVGGWRVTYVNPATQRWAGRHFVVRRFMSDDRSFEQADEAALQAAIAFRADLVAQGILKEAVAKKAPIYRSEIRGVSWQQREMRWQVKFCIGGRSLTRYFAPSRGSPSEIEGARRDAEEQRLAWEQEFGVVQAEARCKTAMQLVRHESGCRYVRWDQWGECWHAQRRPRITDATGPAKSPYVNRRFRPEDLSVDAIERARVAAVRAVTVEAVAMNERI